VKKKIIIETMNEDIYIYMICLISVIFLHFLLKKSSHK